MSETQIRILTDIARLPSMSMKIKTSKLLECAPDYLLIRVRDNKKLVEEVLKVSTSSILTRATYQDYL